MAAQQRHSIGPHPDLPTITEDLLEEEESITPDEEENIDDTQSDSGSKISYSANSYAFTLDGVGFDEENSLISGICNGSVVNHPQEEELIPPQNNNSGSRKDGPTDNERELEHRQACRKLGIPWSSENSDRGSDKDGASGTTATAKNGRKVKKWPWPDITGKMLSTPPPTLDSLDEHMRNYALSNTAGAKKRRATHGSSRWNVNGYGLVATAVLIVICSIAFLMTVMSSQGDHDSVEAEVVIIEGHPHPMVPSIATHDVQGSADNASGEAGSSKHKTKAAKEVGDAASNFVNGMEDDDVDCTTKMCSVELSSSCLMKYKINNTPVTTITIHLFCEGESWIGIGFSEDGQMIGSEAVLGVPGEQPQKYILGGKDDSSVMAMSAETQTLINASVQMTRRGQTVMKFTKIMKEEGEVEIKSGENTFFYVQGLDVNLGSEAVGELFTVTLPDVEEDIMEVEAEDAGSEVIEESIVEETPVEEVPVEEVPDGLDSSCVDQPGKFTTSKNKSRSCQWMLKSGDTLHSSLQDRECGVQSLGTQPSELGLKCRYTCRAYNGCLLQDNHDVSVEVDEVEPPPIDEQVVDEDDTAVVAEPCTLEVCNFELSQTCLLKYQFNIPSSVIPVNTITFELICEGEAWIGIGFSNDGQMIGSEAVLGVPGELPQKYLLAGKDNSSVTPMPAHKQTLIDASVELDSGLTILKFTKIMKEEGEVEIKSGENTFLYAQGMGMDLGYHVVGKSFTLSVPGAVESTVLEDIFSTETPLIEATFVDAESGLLRPCSWLDFRNWDQRQIRRDANCQNELTQAACPTSCATYIIEKEARKRIQPKDIDLIINKTEDLQLKRAHVSIPSDDCFDVDGYFMDSNSTVRQCDWLSSNPDPLDETRKISNCGYLKEPTDLGKMCKLTCGMCDW